MSSSAIVPLRADVDRELAAQDRHDEVENLALVARPEGDDLHAYPHTAESISTPTGQ
jgi:hypothetical protein